MGLHTLGKRVLAAMSSWLMDDGRGELQNKKGNQFDSPEVLWRGTRGTSIKTGEVPASIDKVLDRRTKKL